MDRFDIADSFTTNKIIYETRFTVREQSLTEFIKVRVYSIAARHRANKSRLQKGGPLIYKTPVTSQVILLARSDQQAQWGN